MGELERVRGASGLSRGAGPFGGPLGDDLVRSGVSGAWSAIVCAREEGGAGIGMVARRSNAVAADGACLVRVVVRGCARARVWFSWA